MLITALAMLAAAADPAAARTVWLCRPGLKNNPCEEDLTATVVSPNGRMHIDRAKPARRPPVDCFYVYPTVSRQQRANATLEIDAALRATARVQASRFSTRCRVFAPVYRQVTVRGLSDGTGVTLEAIQTAYSGVRDGWREYLARHNRGRGVVLIGHSQGTFMLNRLVREEIEPRPRVLRRLVSGLLIGGNLTVRKGRTTGGDFTRIPVCRSAHEVGCVVAYSSYATPLPRTLGFGSVTPDAAARGLEAICTNPAALRSGVGRLTSFAPAGGLAGLGVLPAGSRRRLTTPWIGYDRGYLGRCVRKGNANVLQVSPVGVAPKPDTPDAESFGLHFADITIALGTLVDLVDSQSRAYLARTRAEGRRGGSRGRPLALTGRSVR